PTSPPSPYTTLFRSEDAGQDARLDAAAVVAHVDQHVIADAARRDGDAAGRSLRGLDGLHRVDEQVQKHLADLRSHAREARRRVVDRNSTRLNSSHEW